MNSTAKSAKTPEIYHLCRKGVAGSATALDREPTAAELTVLAGAGFELATIGDRYRKRVACPVNGDGYWYTRRYLLDSAGEIVGSFRDDSGPSGEL